MHGPFSTILFEVHCFDLCFIPPGDRFGWEGQVGKLETCIRESQLEEQLFIFNARTFFNHPL